MNLSLKLETTPVYPHDCSNCQYLGTEQFRDERCSIDYTVDLYRCNDTFLARYGAEGYQYASWDAYTLKGMDIPARTTLTQACFRAMQIAEAGGWESER